VRVRIIFRVDDDVAARIDALRGGMDRAAWIEAAIRRQVEESEAFRADCAAARRAAAERWRGG
jgi:predicted transcriptional regulator